MKFGTIGTPRILAALGVAACCGFLASAPQVMAQSFGGMSMLDLEVARDSYFKSADLDGDFALSSEEQMNALSASNAEMYECFDSDGDGVCSYTEFLDSGQRVFDALDLNGDGQLSASEIQAAQ